MDTADPQFWLFAAIVGGAFAIEATTGFGATTLIVTLGADLFPLPTLLAVIVPLGLVLSFAIAWSNRTHVDRALVVRRILTLMGVGLAIGLAIFERASNDGLRHGFGRFVERVFRATLSTVWVVLGTALTLAYAWQDRVGTHSLVATATRLPVLAVAFVAGNWAHHRLDAAKFRILIYALLIVAGLTNAL